MQILVVTHRRRLQPLHSNYSTQIGRSLINPTLPLLPFPRILATCHGVLYKQLSMWMLHGMLMDQPGEFFIEPVTDGVATAEGEEGREVSG